jgi:hypothetical protein
MDPYLEDPSGWPDVHASLLPAIRDRLVAMVSPAYYVRIEERVYLTEPEGDPGYRFLVPDVIVTRPAIVPRSDEPRAASVGRAGTGTITAPVVLDDLLDPAIHDRYLEVREARSHEVVTAIEVLSPANKVPGSRGRRALEEKRGQLRGGGSSWLELDLLRAGERPPRVSGRGAYCAWLLRHGHPGALAWFVGLRDPLPTVAVPLRPPHDDVPLDLQDILHATYDRARYADSVDYSRPVPAPPLDASDAVWVRERIEVWRAARRPPV